MNRESAEQPPYGPAESSALREAPVRYPLLPKKQKSILLDNTNKETPRVWEYKDAKQLRNLSDA